MATQPAFANAVNNGVARFTASDTYIKTLITAGSNGTWVRAINVYSSCAAAQNLRVYLNSGGVDYKLFTVSVPANSGVSGPSINLMDPQHFPAQDPHPNRGIMLKSGELLKIKPTGTPGSSEEIDVTAFAGDF